MSVSIPKTFHQNGVAEKTSIDGLYRIYINAFVKI